MARPSHPKKEVEEALRHAEGQGWRVDVGGSHAWVLPNPSGLNAHWTPAALAAEFARLRHAADGTG